MSKPIFVLLLPVLLLLTAGMVGSTRRLGFWWTLLLSVLLTPIGGFIVAVWSGPRRAGFELEPAPTGYGLPRSE